MTAPTDSALATLRARRDLSPGVLELTLSVPGYQWTPGQHTEVSLPAVKGQTRAYSIANAPSGQSLVQLAVATYETDTLGETLREISPGDELHLSPALGKFRPHGSGPTLYVATGTGLSPIRAMLQDPSLGRPRGNTLLFGCRSQSDLLWEAEHPSWGVNVISTLSRPGAGWAGHQGRVQAHLASALEKSGAFQQYVLCGSVAMVTEVTEILLAHGAHSGQIASESYG